MNTELRNAFRYWMQSPKRPAKLATLWAVGLARGDVATNTHRYPRTNRHTAPGAPFGGYGTKAMRWCEQPSALGLRFVGYADKLADIRHTGWWTDDDGCNESVRGVVYQLPSRNGCPVYVSGYDNQINGTADCDGPAAIDFGTLWHGDVGGNNADSDHYGAHRDAAYHADKLAEQMAENEREYQRAWRAGSQWAERGEEIASIRRDALADLAMRRTIAADMARVGVPKESREWSRACSMVADRVREALASIAKLREERAELASGDFSRGDFYLGFYPSDALKSAFNDGAGATVLT